MMKRACENGFMARTGCVLLLVGALGLLCLPIPLFGQAAAPAVPDEVKKDAEAAKAAPDAKAEAKPADTVDLDKLAESLRQTAAEAGKEKKADAEEPPKENEDPAVKSQAEIRNYSY